MSWRGKGAALRWAAGLAVVTAAGLAATVPRFGGGASAGPDSSVTPTRVVDVPAGSAPAVTVQPVDGAVSITIHEAGAGSRLSVRPADRADVRVEVGGVESPRFTAREGEIAVSLAGSVGAVQVELPRELVLASIFDGTRVVARWESGRIEPAGAVATDVVIGTGPPER